MVSSAPGVPYPLGVQFNNSQPVDDEDIVYGVQESGLKLTRDAEGTLLFQGQSPTGFTITKKFAFTGSQYPIEVELSVNGVAGFQPGLILTSEGTPKGSEKDAAFEGLLTLHDGKVQWITADEIEESNDLSGAISWAGFGYTYFLFAAIPESGSAETLAIEKAGPGMAMKLTSQPLSNAGNQSRYTLYVGPKDLEIMKAIGRDLEKSIYFGYFAFISIPLLYLLHFSHQFTASYGIDIILLTVFVKILMAPLTHKSFVSMKRMQKLQPQMERIKQKFQNDKEKMNKEIMELYRRNKVNPIGGCLPMLLQFPIFIGLYQALLTPIQLRHAPFLWIKDLSQPDWKSLPFELPSWLGGEFGFPVLTLLMGASMFAQQWMTPTAGDPNQRRMMLMMPVIFTVMFVTFPAGLTIYWLVNNILSIAQQYLINRME
jgi:YidC/Oxa1 family membrane protein insertase